MHNEYDENLLEPLKYYNNYLKGHFRKVTEDYFQELVDEAGIDIDKNTELMKEYEEASRNFSGLKSKLNRYLFTKKVIFIIGGGSLLWGGVNFFSANGDADSIFICGILFTLSVGLYFGKVKSKIEDLGTILENLDSMLSNMRQEGYQMMKALNNLFHSEMTAELIKKAIPFIHLDLNFNIRRYEQLVKNYNFKEKDDLDHSTLDVASGDILGNPFVFMKRMVHKIGEYTYKGSLNISYLKYYRDSNGKLCSSRVNETLHAEVKKPGPYYSTMVSLVYGNDAAPELIFHRKPAEKGIFSAFFKKAKLAKKISTIRSQTNKAIKEGGTFQGLSNEEFDALFNALDRNNEIEFRLLFTPLAQQNYQDIFKNSPYGDDFVFCKENKINKIESKNSQNWDFDTTPSNYWGFSFQQIKDRFINFNCNYFDCMYFSFLPLLAIPLYQQMMSNDYVYKDSYNYNYNDYITEEVRKGRRESDVIEELGDPWAIAKNIITSEEMKGNTQESYDSYEPGRRRENSYEQDYGSESGYRGTHVFGLDTWWKKLVLILGIIGIVVLVAAVVGGIISLLAPIFVPLLIVCLIIKLINGRRR